MGRLEIKDLQFRSRHGYHDFERETGNLFSVDVCFETDLAKAGASDRLEDALDYSRACSIISDIMNGPSVHLIEHLLHLIGHRLFDEFPGAYRIEVILRKHQPPLPERCSWVEVSETWKR